MQPTASYIAIRSLIKERILLLDGGMGTMVQRFKLNDKDFWGHGGNNDILVLSRPDVIESIHLEYLKAGADIIESCTFNSNAISQADYGLQSECYKLSKAGAEVAKKAIEKYEAEFGGKHFVAGSIGPTSKATGMASDVEDPAGRAISFKELSEAYRTQIKGLLDGGADILLIETIFDTLNCKAALYAASKEQEERGIEVPVMLSATISDASGRLLAGQTMEAFWNSICGYDLFSVGLNCALGAEEMGSHIAEISRIANVFVSAYPNAGLPNPLGGYDETPEGMAGHIEKFAQNGWVNIVGGCCGTTPENIAAMKKAVQGKAPRKIPEIKNITRLSGLEPVNITEQSNFMNIGERNNMAGSLKFA
ncbi:MAG: homocysteine S-methyltransferase family protein, partial [Fibromonadales bacterium]|nr:homocysteine S-methyltransferase family protein [Fibromonadales bacterium]